MFRLCIVDTGLNYYKYLCWPSCCIIGVVGLSRLLFGKYIAVTSILSHWYSLRPLIELLSCTGHETCHKDTGLVGTGSHLLSRRRIVSVWHVVRTRGHLLATVKMSPSTFLPINTTRNTSPSLHACMLSYS